MTVEVAFIGAGGIASKHLGHLEERDGADVVAVCDIDENAAAEWADVHDAAAFTDWEQMFDAATFDAVFVCVPPFAHEGQEQRAAEEGVHLFVEKPLGLSLAEARETRQVIDDADIISQVGHHWRYKDNVRRARELIGDRPIATIYGRWVGGVPGGEDHWWHHRDRSGGQVVEQSTHIFDLLRYFGGEVDRVAAEGDLRVQTDLLDFPDAVSATIRHEDGLPSNVVSASASPAGDVGVTLVGEGFHLDVHGDVCEGIVGEEEIEFESAADGHHTEVDAFVDAVDTGTPDRCHSPYADAIHTFDLTLAVRDAVDQDGTVEVAL